MNEKLSMSQLGRLTGDEYRSADKNPVILILEDIRSGLNVGSMFRSADAFRISSIICCGYTPIPPHREVLKSALGATESVSWQQSPSAHETILKLKEEGVQCYALEQTAGSTDLFGFTPDHDKVIAIVVGNEVHGVSQQVIDACHGTLEIAQHGTKHSLNAAVSAGIALFHVTSKMAAAK